MKRSSRGEGTNQGTQREGSSEGKATRHCLQVEVSDVHIVGKGNRRTTERMLRAEEIAGPHKTHDCAGLENTHPHVPPTVSLHLSFGKVGGYARKAGSLPKHIPSAVGRSFLNTIIITGVLR